jgi:hypothetical protein
VLLKAAQSLVDKERCAVCLDGFGQIASGLLLQTLTCCLLHALVVIAGGGPLKNRMLATAVH